MKGKLVDKKELSTEGKIKEAARKVFQQKGYAATRTRDIAEEAGINLALLNYYFRSKKNLFDIIMLETVSSFVQSMTTLLNNEDTSLEKKVELIVSHYIDFFTQDPNIPIFMMSELRDNSDGLIDKLQINQVVMDSVFFKQYREAAEKGEVAVSNPMHFLMNLLGQIIFPFIGKPFLKGIGGLNDKQFNSMMQERKKLIPVWMETMVEVTR